MTKISVIIPCFNAQDYIRETLQSVVHQEYDDLEIIVVDDGSTDDSRRIVREEFSFVRLVQTHHAGASQARNIGTQLSSGEFIQYLDADDVLSRGKLKLQLLQLQKDRADVAYGEWQELIPQPDGRFALGRIAGGEIQGSTEVALFTDFWCPPATYLFRRHIVEAVGGWNERLPIIQDARFALDCALHGGQFVFCSGIMAYYRVHSAGSLSTRDPIGFVRDCFKNIVEVEEWWETHGGITEDRQAALLKTYGQVARASFEKDRVMFEDACQALERLKPRYIPDHPRHLAVASRFLGYKRAEHLARWYRQTKKHLRNRLVNPNR